MEHNVCLEIRKFDNEIRRKIESLRSAETLNGMTAMHGWIISYLIENSDSPIYQKDIEDTFKIRPSSVTSLLKLMEKNGLIVRRSVEADARLKRIEPTDKAYSCYMSLREEIDRMQELMIRDVSDEEMKHFYRVIAKFRSNLTKGEN